MSTNKRIKITILIVNYNSNKHTNNLLRSLQLISQYVGEVIIVDNNSNDIEPLKLNNQILLIRNTNNVGFSKAVNIGLTKASHDIVLLINPDCYIENTSIIQTIETIYKDTSIAIIGGRIKNTQNNFQPTATNIPNFLTALFEFTNLKKVFPNNKFSKNFWVELGNFNKNQPQRVTSLCGAFMILRKTIANTPITFDEDYFLYLEDLDLGIRLNQKGLKIMFDPRSEIIHLRGKSNQSQYGIVLQHWYKSRKIFFKKHLSQLQGYIINIIFSIEENLLTLYHHLKHEPAE